MTDDNSATDLEMDRLLTPGGHLSRAEQDEVAADVFHQLTANSLASKSPWWKVRLPLGIASALGAAAVLFVWLGDTSLDPAEFTARGAATQVQLRCNAEAPAFFGVGEHTLPRCKGQLEIHIATPDGVETGSASLALVSDDDDLRWALPAATDSSSISPTTAGSAHSVVVAARGDEQLLLIKIETTRTPRAALATTWGENLKTWKMPRASPTMRLVFESSLGSERTAP